MYLRKYICGFLLTAGHEVAPTAGEPDVKVEHLHFEAVVSHQNTVPQLVAALPAVQASSNAATYNNTFVMWIVLKGHILVADEK